MYVGKIVSSNSHIEYVCQIYNRGEVDSVPQPRDYALGTFVAIECAEGDCLVGIVCNTMLMNPEYGNLGPRLSPREELSVFSPDYLEEHATLVTIVTVGTVEAAGASRQDIPEVAPEIDAPVRRLSRDEVIAFHKSDEGVRMAYVPLLAAMGTPITSRLLGQIVERMIAFFPQDTERLRVLGDNLAWKERVLPLG